MCASTSLFQEDSPEGKPALTSSAADPQRSYVPFFAPALPIGSTGLGRLRRCGQTRSAMVSHRTRRANIRLIFPVDYLEIVLDSCVIFLTCKIVAFENAPSPIYRRGSCVSDCTVLSKFLRNFHLLILLVVFHVRRYSLQNALYLVSQGFHNLLCRVPHI